MTIEERRRGRPLAERLATTLRERDMDEVSSLEHDFVVQVAGAVARYAIPIAREVAARQRSYVDAEDRALLRDHGSVYVVDVSSRTTGTPAAPSKETSFAFSELPNGAVPTLRTRLRAFVGDGFVDVHDRDTIQFRHVMHVASVMTQDDVVATLSSSDPDGAEIAVAFRGMPGNKERATHRAIMTAAAGIALARIGDLLATLDPSLDDTVHDILGMRVEVSIQGSERSIRVGEGDAPSDRWIFGMGGGSRGDTVRFMERGEKRILMSLERDLVVGHDAFLDAYPSLDGDSFRTLARNLAEIHERLTAQPGAVPPRP